MLRPYVVKNSGGSIVCTISKGLGTDEGGGEGSGGGVAGEPIVANGQFKKVGVKNSGGSIALGLQLHIDEVGRFGIWERVVEVWG